jgi:hypothetical protein
MSAVKFPLPSLRLMALTPGLQFAALAVYVIPFGLVILLDPVGWFWTYVLYAMALVSPLVFGSGLVLGWLVSRKRGATRPDGSEYVVATTGTVLMGAALALSLFFWVALVMSELALREL